MKITDSMDPGILRARTSGHVALTLFGLPFFGAGCLIIAAWLGYIPVEGGMPGYTAIPFGALFGIVGLVLMTGRAGIVVDKRTNICMKWHGLLVPMIRKEYPLDFYGRVTLRKEVTKSKNSSTTIYPVRLEGESDENKIDFGSSTDYNESRGLAEQLAKFLKMSVVDYSSGTEIIREHDKLDESIREQVERTGDKIELPDPPPDMKSLVNEDFGTVKIEIPPPGFNALHYIQLAAPFLFFGFIVVFIFGGRGSELPPPLMIALIALFFFVLPFTVMFFKVFPKAKKRFVITASRAALQIEENMLGRIKNYEIPAEELEELEISGHAIPDDFSQMMEAAGTPDEDDTAKESYDSARQSMEFHQKVETNPKLKGCIGFIVKLIPGPQITARSDKATIEFGRGLSSEELSYIHAAIKKAMTQ